MARYSDELRDALTRIHSPHCTPACHDCCTVQVSRNVSFVPPLRARHILPTIDRTILGHGACHCDCQPPVITRQILPSILDRRIHDHRPCHCECHPPARCSCDTVFAEERVIRFPTHVKRTATVSSKSTYSILEKWFKKFKNEKGYLEHANLTELVENVRGSSDKVPIRRALKEADADGDNQLSFKEYLHMWHKAASHESDFLDATGCQDIVDIVLEYDLYPNVSCRDCDGFRHHLRKDVEHEAEDQARCNCGGEQHIMPFIQIPTEISDASGHTKVFNGELPLFSCNRLPACQPKNWRD